MMFWIYCYALFAFLMSVALLIGYTVKGEKLCVGYWMAVILWPIILIAYLLNWPKKNK